MGSGTSLRPRVVVMMMVMMMKYSIWFLDTLSYIEGFRYHMTQYDIGCIYCNIISFLISNNVKYLIANIRITRLLYFPPEGYPKNNV